MAFNFADRTNVREDFNSASHTHSGWQTVSADTWVGIKPSESQLNQPVHAESLHLPSAQSRADSIAGTVAEAGLNRLLLIPNDKDVLHGGTATEQILDRVNQATQSITDKEYAVARQQFAALPPEEQKLVQQEAQMRNMYTEQRASTPHFDAFAKSVEKALAPYENQRDATVNGVLAKLPPDLVRAKQEEDFFKNSVKAL
jgi:hypothetical protein